MATAELHFFDADDPNGSSIFECSTDDEFVKSVKLNVQRDMLGGGQVTFARKVGVGLFTREIVVPEVLVRVLIPAIHSTKYVHGFWINPRQQQVISKSEQGGEGFIFGGPGPKHYLERMILWSGSYTGLEGNVYADQGIWVWPETARAGAILNRLLQEDADNPHGPFLPDLTNSFDGTDDSNGDPWDQDLATGDDDFTLRIQDDYLKILWTIEDRTGITTVVDLGTVSNPRLQLEAYQTYGRDLTGSFGAGVVRWQEGVNIQADLDVEGSSYAKASHALVKGNEAEYRIVQKPSWSPGELKKVVGIAFDATNHDALDLAGERFLRRQDFGEQQIDLKIITGFDEDAGLYMPGWTGSDGHFWTGDTITLTTGMGSPTVLDYQSEDQAITGFEMELVEAVRDDTDEAAARSWDITVFLNEERKSSNTSRDLAGNRGTVSAPPNIIRLCRLPSAGESFSQRLYFSNVGSGIGSVAQSAGWEDPLTNEPFRLTTAPDDNYNAGTSTVFDAPGTPVGDYVQRGYAFQITSAELLAQIQAGGLSLNAQIRCRSKSGAGVSEANQNNIYQWLWRVWRSGGTGFIGTMLDLHALGSGTKWPAQATPVNRTFEGTADDVAGAALNDYIIIEMGTRHLGPITGGAGASIVYTAQSAFADLPVDETTSTNLNSWIELSISGVGSSPGDLPLDTVRQDDETAGTSSRVARCDHQHAHGLIAVDGSNYHSLSQLSNYIVDAGAAPTVNDDATDGYTTGTLWIDDSTSPEAVYILVDPTAGAAVWVELNVGTLPAGTDPGDLMVYDGADWTALPIGASDDDVLTIDSGEALGVKWATPTAPTQEVSVRKNSAGSVFTRGKLNVIEGGNVTLTVADDAGNDEIDITIAASGGGGGGYSSGSSFPGSPSTGDIFHRTDLQPALWRYDGTRWLCTCLHEHALGTERAISATSSEIYTPVRAEAMEMWIIDYICNMMTASGSTGSAYWTTELRTYTTSTSSLIASQSNISATNNSHVRFAVAIDAVGASTIQAFSWRVVKVSTPGTFTGGGILTYRLIGT